MRYNASVAPMPIPSQPPHHHTRPYEVPRIDPERERADAARAWEEMRSAALIITLSMGIAVLAGMLILAWGHFGL